MAVTSSRHRGPRCRLRRSAHSASPTQEQAYQAPPVGPLCMRAPRRAPRGCRGARKHLRPGGVAGPAAPTTEPPPPTRPSCGRTPSMPSKGRPPALKTSRPVPDGDFAGGRFADEASVRRWRHAWRRCRQALPTGHVSVHDMVSTIHQCFLDAGGAIGRLLRGASRPRRNLTPGVAVDRPLPLPFMKVCDLPSARRGGG